MRVSGGQVSGSGIVVPFPARQEPRILDPHGIDQRDVDRRDTSQAGDDDCWASDIAFLRQHGVPVKVLHLALRLAKVRGTEAHDELFAMGFDRRRYWSLLARSLDLPFAADLRDAQLLSRGPSISFEAVRLASSVLVNAGGRNVLVVAPHGKALLQLRRRLAHDRALARHIRIAAPETIRAFLVARRHRALNHYAVTRLLRVMPRLSASDLLRRDRVSGPVTLIAACAGMALVAPAAMAVTLMLASTLLFLNCAGWKAAAACRRARPIRAEPVASARLPTYTVLVPLYGEAGIVADLVRHLVALDYPASKLQILILLEADDHASRDAVAQHAVSPLFETVVVPPGGPRTKPKALTYSLPFVRGEYVVVFDAEDRPEADQLRRAAAAFREHPDLGCLQARLTPDNLDSWFARMFAIEYAANFEIVLPALADARVPLPLGGTSNHFPRRVLERVSGWDPYNVTEDADLGIRLARYGYRSATLLSRTYEEAPESLALWLPQRRRWIKGWMQTAIVCMAGPVPGGMRLTWTEGLAVHGTITAGVLGLLLYPVSFILAAVALTSMGGDWSEQALWQWAWRALNMNLAVIVIAAVVCALRGVRSIGAPRLVPWIACLPVYWGFMSYAAWGALFQLIREPSRWEKTPHGVARQRRTPGGPDARRSARPT